MSNNNVSNHIVYGTIEDYHLLVQLKRKYASQFLLNGTVTRFRISLYLFYDTLSYLIRRCSRNMSVNLVSFAFSGQLLELSGVILHG